MKVPGIEEMLETFLAASDDGHGNVDPGAGLLAVFETHVKGMVAEAFAAGTEGRVWIMGAPPDEPRDYAERILAQLKEPRHGCSCALAST